jgi:hypothetical protein
VKKGDEILFWDDVWLGGTPLKLQYPDLYNFCDDPGVLVEGCYDSDGWEIGFRRTFTINEAEQRTDLLNRL